MKIGPSAFKRDEALNINPEEILERGKGDSLLLNMHVKG